MVVITDPDKVATLMASKRERTLLVNLFTEAEFSGSTELNLQTSMRWLLKMFLRFSSRICLQWSVVLMFLLFPQFGAWFGYL